MKIEEMADVFLNSANFAPHAFLTLAPPSGYALNLKVLIKVSKVSWRSQLSYEILKSSFERKFDKTNFVSPKKTPPKSLRSKRVWISWMALFMSKSFPRFSAVPQKLPNRLFSINSLDQKLEFLVPYFKNLNFLTTLTSKLHFQILISYNNLMITKKPQTFLKEKL